MRIPASLTMLAALSLSGIASAQDHQHGGAHSNQAQTAEAPHEACRPAASGEAMPQMPMTEEYGMRQGMNPASQGLVSGMMKHMPAMMQGSLAEDADVAFVCAMIPHHQSAIDMARVVLEHGDDPETKRIAEKIIADQEREIAEMTAWLDQHAQ